MSHSIASSIMLRSLEFDLHLGWPEAERAQKQQVWVDIHFQFSQPPRACKTDDLVDTFCYDQLVQALKIKIATRQFRLLEHLGHELYHWCKELITQDVLIQVRVRKKPLIENLNDGVTFTYGDTITVQQFFPEKTRCE